MSPKQVNYGIIRNGLLLLLILLLSEAMLLQF